MTATEQMFTHRRLNSKGMTTYWQSVNDAFESWDKTQMRMMKSAPQKSKAKKKLMFREQCSDTRKFKWNPEKTKFKLPALADN